MCFMPFKVLKMPPFYPIGTPLANITSKRYWRKIIMNCSLPESLDEKVIIPCISKNEKKQTKVIIFNSNMDEIRMVADEFMNAVKNNKKIFCLF